MIIWNTQAGSGAVLCFTGAGYMGVSIYHVNEVQDVVPQQPTSLFGVSEWFKWYNGGPGYYQSLLPGYSHDFGGGVTSVYVTQLCIGDASWPDC